MNRILFVDDEPNVQERQRRMLYSLRNEWDMKSVSSGAEAPMARTSKAGFSDGSRCGPSGMAVFKIRCSFVNFRKLITTNTLKWI
jgi:hypothetical protein